MAQRWYQKASVQVTIVSGIFAVIIVIVTWFLNKSGPEKYLGEQPTLWEEENWSDFSALEEFIFDTTRVEIGIHILQFEAESAKGRAKASEAIRYIENQINRKIEDINKDVNITEQVKVLAKAVPNIYVKSHEQARKFGARCNSDLVVWGSVQDFDEITFDPVMTIIDTTKPKYTWQRQSPEQLDPLLEKPKAIFVDKEHNLIFPRQSIDTPLQFSLYLVAYGLRKANRQKEALELLEEVVKIPNKYQKHMDEVYAELSGLYGYLRKYDQQLESIKKAYKINPDSPETLNDLANAYRNVGIQKNDLVFLDRADSLFQKLLQIDPGSRAVTYNNMHYVSLAKGDTAKAIAQLRKVIELEPTNVVAAAAYSNLSVYSYYSGNLDSAMVYSERAYTLAPERAAVVNNYIANLFEIRKDTLRAVQGLLDAIERMPYHIEFRFNLGLYYLSIGEYKKSIETFEETVKIVPNTSAQIGVAAGCSKLRKIDRAYEVLHKIVPIITIEDPQVPGDVAENIRWILEDEDFENVRQDSRWPDLREKLTERISKK